MAREVLIPKEWEYTKQIQKIIKKQQNNQKTTKTTTTTGKHRLNRRLRRKKNKKNSLAAQCDFEGHTWKTC